MNAIQEDEFKAKLDKLEQQYKAVMDANDKLNEKIEDNQEALSELDKADMDKLRNSLENIDDSVGDLDGRFDDLRRQLENLDSEGLDKFNNDLKEAGSAVESLGDYYFATFIPTKEAVLSIDWVLSQSITFIIIGIIFFIAMLVVIIIGCYKATLLLRIDRRASKTPNSIVIRLDKNGDVIFANSTFKRLEYELDKINIDDFIEVDTGKPIKELFVEKKTLKCYLDKGDKITYFQFTPLAVLSTYYLVGSDISIDYRRVMFLEESNGRHVITGCYNRFALRNRFETVLSNLKVDAAFVEFLITDYIDIITLFGNQTFEELLRQIVKMLNAKS